MTPLKTQSVRPARVQLDQVRADVATLREALSRGMPTDRKGRVRAYLDRIDEALAAGGDGESRLRRCALAAYECQTHVRLHGAERRLIRAIVARWADRIVADDDGRGHRHG